LEGGRRREAPTAAKETAGSARDQQQSLLGPVVAARDKMAVDVQGDRDDACPMRDCTIFGGTVSPPSILRLMLHEA
jgi:hypothetical protein